MKNIFSELKPAFCALFVSFAGTRTLGDFIFYPGRLGKYNMSNSVIDSGACSDVLASFYLAFQTKLTSQEKEQIKEAVFKNCSSYLIKASVDKEITNQRLWGSTGLASAYKAFGEQSWQEACLKSIGKSLSEMWPDGSFPYHPNWQKYGLPQAANDITPYYHSRCIAFIFYALENFGQNFEPYREKLVNAADLLCAMYRPDGIKVIELESKRWYWNSPYEIASNAFDVYALVKTYQLTGRLKYLYYAQKSLNQILKHQLKDGGITSHLGSSQYNFQCRVFWNSHLAWLVRAIEAMPDLWQKQAAETNEGWPAQILPKAKIVAGWQEFPQAGFKKFKNEQECSIIQTKTKSPTLMWGSLYTKEALLYQGKKLANWQNQANLKQQPKIKPKMTKAEIKKRLYHIFIELRALRLRTVFYLLCYSILFNF